MNWICGYLSNETLVYLFYLIWISSCLTGKSSALMTNNAKKIKNEKKNHIYCKNNGLQYYI